MRTLAPLSLLILATALPAADEKFNPADRTRALAPLIEEETYALLRIDATRVDPEGMLKTLGDWLPKYKEEIRDRTLNAKEFLALFAKAGGRELVLSFSSEDLPGLSFVYLPLPAGANADALTRILKGVLEPGQEVQKRGDALVAGTPAVLARLAKGKPAPRTELLPAVAAAGDTAIQALLLPARDHRRVVEELVTLPVPGGSGKALVREVRWAALGVDVGPKPTASLTIHSADEDAAKQLSALVKVGLKALGEFKFQGEEKPVKDLFGKEYEAAREVLKPTVEGDRVTLGIRTPEAWKSLLALASSAEQRASGGVAGSVTAGKMKQILIALHTYHDAHGAFPPQAIFSKDGKPLLSWRVALLPFIEEGALYNEFKLDEPWDSEHNKKLIEKMPKPYRGPRGKGPPAGYTTFLVPVNKAFVFTGEGKGLKVTDILDGTSATGILLDVSDEAAVPWTKPADLEVSEKDPWKGILGHQPNFAWVGLADGSLTRVVKTVPGKTLWALFTRAGGEVLPDLSK